MARAVPLLTFTGLHHPVGGVARYTLALHRTLQEIGVPVTLFAGAYGRAMPDGIEGALAVKTANVRGAGLASRIALEAYLMARGRNVALVHHPFPPFWSAGRSPRRPLVVTVHDLAQAHVPEAFEEPQAVLLHQARWARQADTVLTVSETTKADIVSVYAVPEDRVRVTPLGVEPCSATDLVRRDVRNVLYVGNRKGYKNWRVLISALRHPDLGEVRLTCAGGGAWTDEERQLMDAAGIATRVELVNPDDAELCRLYRRAGAVVCTSLFEGFGLPLLEAMLHECPVVTSPAGSLREVGGDACAFFDPRDDEALATTLTRVLADSVLRKEMAAAGCARADAATWSRTAQLTAAVYEQLAP